MRHLNKMAAIVLVLLLSIIIAYPTAAAPPDQNGDYVYRILAGVNAARVAGGLPPYALNALLTQAAQAHSEYQRDTGQITHDSADGSRTLDRVLAVGYPAIRANENIYAGMGPPEDAVAWWLASTAGHVQNIMHPVMREVGIGVASASNGMTYYTIDFSAQPNVLPVFINSDSYTTSSPQVIVTLTNEGIFTGGAGQIGRATQVMLSNTPDFAGAVVQPWSQYISWTLPDGSGLKTVYVRYIDSAGRTADAQDSIVLDEGSGAAIPPTLIPTFIPQPTSPILLPTNAPVQPTAFPLPTLTPTPLATSTAPAVAELPGMSPATPVFQRPAPAEPVVLFGLTASTLRRGLTAALMLGVGCAALGALILFHSARRAHRKG